MKRIFYKTNNIQAIANATTVHTMYSIPIQTSDMGDTYQIVMNDNTLIQGQAAINMISDLINVNNAPIINTKIIILWATARPKMFKTAHKKWIDNATNSSNIIIRVAVDTQHDADQLNEYNVIITNNTTPGVCYPSYCLSSTTRANDNDIIILASDDFIPPKNWDKFLLTNLHTTTPTLLLVNDGIQPVDAQLVTIPIMTYSALQKLNHIIYNPNYNHMCSDNELYDIASELELIKDVRSANIIFQHQHYANDMRNRDDTDDKVMAMASTDSTLYHTRKSKSIKDRLFISNDIKLKLTKLTYNKPNLNIVTSISPKNIEHQVNCINSWKKWSSTIYALNTKSEIAILKTHFPFITFIESYRDASPIYNKSYMYIDDIMNVTQWMDNDVIAIINSDISFEDELFNHNIHLDIISKATSSFIYANRYDVKSDSKSLYKLGFDMFLFPPKFIDCIPKNNLAMGVPWWDYYLPMVSLLTAYPTIHWLNKYIVHQSHSTNYSDTLYEQVTPHVIKTLNSITSKHSQVPNTINPALYANQLLYNIWSTSTKLTQYIELESDIESPITHGSIINGN